MQEFFMDRALIKNTSVMYSSFIILKYCTWTNLVNWMMQCSIPMPCCQLSI